MKARDAFPLLKHTTTGWTSLPVMTWLLMMLLIRAGCSNRLSSVNPRTDLMALFIASSVGASRMNDWLPSVSVCVYVCVCVAGTCVSNLWSTHIPPRLATSISNDSIVKFPSRSAALPSVSSLQRVTVLLGALAAPVRYTRWMCDGTNSRSQCCRRDTCGRLETTATHVQLDGTFQQINASIPAWLSKPLASRRNNIGTMFRWR